MSDYDDANPYEAGKIARHIEVLSTPDDPLLVPREHLPYFVWKQAFDEGDLQFTVDKQAEVRSPWHVMLLYRLLHEANIDHWNFAVTGMYQWPILVAYLSGSTESPSHQWHQDYQGMNPIDRSKLAISVLVEAPEKGGGLEIRDHGVVPMDVGDACVIPGYVMHRVQPVSRGRRVALVGWLGGPEWK